LANDWQKARYGVVTIQTRAGDDDKGRSHLQAALLGPSLSVLVEDGKLAPGAWQQIFHLECDVQPRARTMAPAVIGA